MKKVRYKKFDGSIVVLIILLCIWIIPRLIYWAVKRREFLFDVLTQDELVPELEKFQTTFCLRDSDLRHIVDSLINTRRGASSSNPA